MPKLTIKDIDIKGKQVLMRVDFNVPLDDNLSITDDTRIRAALPTIKYALDNNAKLILMSHLGRPKGKVIDKMRLDPVAKRLGELLGKEVTKLNDCIGEDVKQKVDALNQGEIILLENLRFHEEEKDNDENFARALAGLGEVFVNDAFGAAHRAHASTEGVSHFLPSVAGFLMVKEIEFLDKALTNPEKPFIAILGGAKVSGKIEVMQNLMDKVDEMLVGGGMAYTFLKVQGEAIGNSKLEEEKLDVARGILDRAGAAKVKIVLPKDHIVADKLSADAKTQEVRDIPDNWIALDIGPETVRIFKERLSQAKTILWNGPLGFFEIEPFSKGTKEIAYFMANLDALTIIGGGDTAAAITQLNLQDKMTHISTGGGASLEYLEGKTLPGIAALKDKN